MKFIFPQNYDFKNKLLGFIDYTTAFINLVWCVFILLLSHFIFHSITIVIFCCVVFCFPLMLLSFAGFNGENILYVFSYLINFALKQKLYLYKK